MAEQKNLNEFINELNERIYALEMVQKSIVAIIVAQNETFKELFIDALQGYDDLAKKFQGEKISEIINSYIRLAEGKQAGEYKPHLHLVLRDKTEDE